MTSQWKPTTTTSTATAAAAAAAAATTTINQIHITPQQIIMKHTHFRFDLSP